MTLRISLTLTLPDKAVAETFGILAKRGSGKSNAAVVMAEEMWDARIPWIAIDPKGDWWGIRSSANGKKPGLALPVFGGLHGDVPLRPDGGNQLADLIVDRRLTCVIDVAEFSKGEQTRFLIDFAERLFRKQRSSPEPMHMFLEEAHEYLPQRVMRDQARLVGAYAKIVKQGRSFGLGSTTISQRSASLNKDVLTQIETLIVLRTTSPQDRKAILAWVEEHDLGKELVASLPELDDGEAWVWSPHFLKLTKRINFRRRRTFDSGATPELGKVRKPSTIADIDISAIEQQWAESIERAKDENPRELKMKVKELERQLARQVPIQADPMTVEVPVVPDGFMDTLIDVSKILERTGNELSVVNDVLSEMRSIAARIQQAPRSSSGIGTTAVPVRSEVRPRPAGSEAGSVELSKMQRKILTALAQYPDGLVSTKLLLLTGYRMGGAWNTALSRLRENGYITREHPVRITDSGRSALGYYEPLPTGRELFDYWKGQIGQMGARIMDELFAVWPRGMSSSELLDATGYKLGGAWNTALSRLRKLDILTTAQPVNFTQDFADQALP